MKSILTIGAALSLVLAGHASAEESPLAALKEMGGSMTSVTFPRARPLTPRDYLLTALDQIDFVLPTLSGEPKYTMVTAKLDIVFAIVDIRKRDAATKSECSIVFPQVGTGEACIYLDDRKMACHENKDLKNAQKEVRQMEAESKCVFVDVRRSRVILEKLAKANRLLADMKNQTLTAPIQLSVSRAMKFFQD